MKIEDQVVSPETAKKLQELKVPQESYFYLVKDYENEEDFYIVSEPYKFRESPYYQIYSAFTVAELGMFFPITYNSIFMSGFGFTEEDSICSEISYRPKHEEIISFEVITSVYGNSEADARANMIIHLIETGMIKVEDLKL